MKILKKLIYAAAIGAGLALSVASHAQTAAAASAKAVVDTTEGEVRKVDKENKKITLKHGEIRNLEMPPMTMVFQVSDAAMLDKVKAGDKVRFKAANDGGKMTVTEIQPAR